MPLVSEILEEYVDMLMSMCLSYKRKGISAETFVANLDIALERIKEDTGLKGAEN